MDDADKIKKQERLDSKNLSPEEAKKGLDELKDEELEDVSGGIDTGTYTIAAPYDDRWSPTPTFIKK
jgi:hypothetical protein